MFRILAIGGVCADISGFPFSPIVERDSNPSRITLHAGGVGFNIARGLASLGREVSMICALGRDAFARALALEAERAGVTLLPVEAERSGVYLCVNDEAGDMRFAFSDLEGTEARLTPEALSAFMPELSGCGACVLDGNLTENALAFITESVSAPIFADPVSTKKALRFLPVMDRLCGIKPNIYEARALTGLEDPLDCAEKLLDMGAKHAFVSCGEGGIAYAGPGCAGVAPCEPVSGCTTGAGDAACAMLFDSLLKGASAKEAAEAANRFAAGAIALGTRLK